METIKINNNISLHYIKMNKFKTNVAGVYIKRPLSLEEASKNAVLSYVLKNGCKKYPSLLKISEELGDLFGAKLNSGVLKNGDNQILFFDAETISDKYAPDSEKTTKGLINLLMQVIFEPLAENNSFIKEIVQREKKTVEDKIDAQINDKRTYAQLKCTQILAKDDIFSITKYGTKEEIKKIDEKNLYSHYEKIIKSSQIDIFICGDTNIDELAEQIKLYTDNLSFDNPVTTNSKLIKKSDEVKKVFESLDVTQGKLSIGYTTDIDAKNPLYPALVVANSIFGSGTHSKLFNNVREKLSLAYYASSSINKFKGIMYVNAGIEFDKFQQTYDEINCQLQELKKGNISDDEFNFSKLTILNSLNSYYDDQRYMQMYALDCIYLDTPFSLSSYKEKIEKVTISDVIKAANSINENTVYFLKGKN